MQYTRRSLDVGRRVAGKAKWVNVSLLKEPSAYLPVALSLAALAGTWLANVAAVYWLS